MQRREHHNRVSERGHEACGVEGERSNQRLRPRSVGRLQEANQRVQKVDDERSDALVAERSVGCTPEYIERRVTERRCDTVASIAPRRKMSGVERSGILTPGLAELLGRTGERTCGIV